MGDLLDRFGRRLGDGDGRAVDWLTADDARVSAQMATEIRALEAAEGAALMAVFPLEALQLAGLLQLALRHPGVPAAHRETGRMVLEQLREYFSGSPAILEILRRGDDPREDT